MAYHFWDILPGKFLSQQDQKSMIVKDTDQAYDAIYDFTSYSRDAADWDSLLVERWTHRKVVSLSPVSSDGLILFPQS